jgi:hypothetical protein
VSAWCPQRIAFELGFASVAAGWRRTFPPPLAQVAHLGYSALSPPPSKAWCQSVMSLVMDRASSLRPPRLSYHTVYKFGVGPRNEPHVPKFLPPSPPARVFPELHEAGLASIAVRAAHPHTTCRPFRRGARPHPARPRPGRVDVSLLSSMETARRRVSHQSLVASALLRVARFVLGRRGSLGSKTLGPLRKLSNRAPNHFPGSRRSCA